MNVSSILLSLWIAPAISGFVIDVDGNPLPGVTISIDGARTVTTGMWGEFGPVEAPEGDHDLVATLDGFTSVTTSVRIPRTPSIRVALRMEVASITEVLEVRSGDSASELETGLVEWALDPAERVGIPVRRLAGHPLASGRWETPRREPQGSSLILPEDASNSDEFDVVFATSAGCLRGGSLRRRARFEDGRVVLNYPVKEVEGLAYQTLDLRYLSGSGVLVPYPWIRDFEACAPFGCPDFNHYFRLRLDGFLASRSARQVAPALQDRAAATETPR
ncbi:MAG: hypothetical protein AMXMBFR36_12290 [Acidobacteriota bacterium]